MKRIRIVGLALAAVLPMSAVAAASASAHEFVASVAPGELVSKQTTNQVFTTKAGTVTCTVAKGTGTIAAKVVMKQVAKVTYEKCTGSFFGFPITFKNISAEYEFLPGPSGTEGEVKIQKEIVIEATSAGLCTVKVPGQGPLANAVTYKNSSPVKTMELIAHTTGIESTGSGSACTYATEKEGKEEGSNLAEEVGGTLEYH